MEHNGQVRQQTYGCSRDWWHREHWFTPAADIRAPPRTYTQEGESFKCVRIASGQTKWGRVGECVDFELTHCLELNLLEHNWTVCRKTQSAQAVDMRVITWLP
jgi:hypothetical protein